MVFKTTETVSAIDANFTIDGVPITRTSNIVDDLINGVTLTLKSTTSSAETVSASYNSDTAYLAFSLLVDELNTIKTNINALTDRGDLTSEAGALAGDPTATYLKNQISTIINSPITGFDDDEIYLAYFGFQTQQDGSYIVDEDTFKNYFETNQEHFSAILNSRVTTGSSLVNASMLGDNYTAGVYSFVL